MSAPTRAVPVSARASILSRLRLLLASTVSGALIFASGSSAVPPPPTDTAPLSAEFADLIVAAGSTRQALFADSPTGAGLALARMLWRGDADHTGVEAAGLVQAIHELLARERTVTAALNDPQTWLVAGMVPHEPAAAPAEVARLAELAPELSAVARWDDAARALLAEAASLLESARSQVNVAEERVAAAQARLTSTSAQVAAALTYPNGMLPDSVLCAANPTGLALRCDADWAWEALSAEFRSVFGYHPGAVSGYRTLAGQVALYASRPALAATPGYSMHGYGLAIDLTGTPSVAGSAAHRWLVENGPRFGWVWPDWARTVKFEPWHFEYTPGKSSDVPVLVTPGYELPPEIAPPSDPTPEELAAQVPEAADPEGDVEATTGEDPGISPDPSAPSVPSPEPNGTPGEPGEPSGSGTSTAPPDTGEESDSAPGEPAAPPDVNPDDGAEPDIFDTPSPGLPNLDEAGVPGELSEPPEPNGPSEPGDPDASEPTPIPSGGGDQSGESGPEAAGSNSTSESTAVPIMESSSTPSSLPSSIPTPVEPELNALPPAAVPELFALPEPTVTAEPDTSSDGA